MPHVCKGCGETVGSPPDKPTNSHPLLPTHYHQTNRTPNPPLAATSHLTLPSTNPTLPHPSSISSLYATPRPTLTT